MNVIVTDNGFESDTWSNIFLTLDKLLLINPKSTNKFSLDVPNTTDPKELAPLFARISLIRIAFLNSTDGRGVTLASHLRLLGYKGRLRAQGHVLADQYTMARRCGYDEIEISIELADRQPEKQWLSRSDWKSNCYINQLKQLA